MIEARPSGLSSLPPLVVHIVYRFDTGGLENGVVNLINRMPADAYRHAVVALTEVVPGFAARVQRQGVEFISLHKPPGHGVRLYPRLYRLFRERRPAIVHTRNLAALECQVPAMLAGVPVRIHGEHGRDMDDLDGSNVRQQRIRRLYRPFVHHYVTLSRDLTDYMTHKVGVQPQCRTEICNGVDTKRFHPASGARDSIPGCPFTEPGLWLAGTVGRMQQVKAQTTLAQAFVRALQLQPTLQARLRLVMVGDGPLRAEAQAILDSAGVAHLAWLPGERTDVPQIMRGLDGFVLPRWPRASPTPFSRPWPVACPCWPRQWVAMPIWCRPVRRVPSCRRAMCRHWLQACCKWPLIPCTPRRWASAGAPSPSSASA